MFFIIVLSGYKWYFKLYKRVFHNNNIGEFINLWADINFNQVWDLSAKELMKKLTKKFKAEN